MFFKRTKQIIGVELGSACLKAAVIELNEGTKELLVREYAIQSLEATTHDLVTSLGLLLSKLKTKCRDCAIAAWPDSAIFRFFEHDPTSTTPIRSVLNPDSSSSQGLDEYILDFVDAGKGKQSPKGRLYAACGVPRGELEATRDLFKQLKYNIQLFQLTPIAVFNAYHSSLEVGPAPQPFLAIDFGRKRTSLSGGEAELHLMRAIEWGSDDLQRALVEQQLLTDSQTLQDLTLPSERLKEALQEAILPLVRQIEFSLDYLRMEVDSGMVRDVHISGGLSNFGFFVEALQEAMAPTPCVKWNPFRKMQATNAALKETGLLVDLFRLQPAAGAAIQFLK